MRLLFSYLIRPIVIFLLMVCLWVVVIPISPQASDQEAVQQENLYSQLVRAVVRLEEHQSICTPGRNWAIERDVAVGSAFFVRDRFFDGSDEEENRYYIVTARHVVENRAELFARVQAGPSSDETYIIRLPRQQWIFHPASISEGKLPIDIAVLRISPTRFMKTFLHCKSDENPEGCGIDDTSKKTLKNQVGEPPTVMSRAVFFGFPIGEVAKHAVEPFARAGVVAYTTPNPDLRINGLPLADDSVFLIDAPAFPGNSGGPLIMEQFPLRSEIKLLGLVTGGNRIGRDYAIITSVQRIRETLVYARSIPQINQSTWSKQPPKLPIKCAPDSDEGVK